MYEALRSIFSRSPYRLRKFESAALRRLLDERHATGDYDLVHYDQFGVAPYWRADSRSTYACQNVESEAYRLAVMTGRTRAARWWARLEAVKLRRSERRLLPRFDEVLILAPDDDRLLRDLGVVRTRLIPMPAPPVREPRRDPPADRTILSLGTMSWFGVEDGLLWFRTEVYPRIRAVIPDVKWVLVGPNAGPAINQLDGVDGIRVRGYVDDLAPVFDKVRVAIVPLHIGGGIRMKLLDLMAAGVPTVSTPLGARGLAFPDGHGCFRREDAASFAHAVVQLLTDDECWRSTAELGRRYVREHHRPEFLEQSIRAAFQAVTGRDETDRGHA